MLYLFRSIKKTTKWQLTLIKAKFKIQYYYRFCTKNKHKVFASETPLLVLWSWESGVMALSTFKQCNR